ncbi:hypothetical protein JB92DRAFT_2959417, partial [Gautieria morchelliformis]
MKSVLPEWDICICRREDECHPCFKHDRSLLEDFWAAIGSSPDDFPLGGDVRVEPPTFYIEKCRSKKKSAEAELRKASRAIDASCVTQADISESDDCDSLFGDSGYISASTPPALEPAHPQSTNLPVTSAVLPVFRARPKHSSRSRKDGGLGPKTISFATYDKKTGSLVTKKLKSHSIGYLNPPSERSSSVRLPPLTGQGNSILSGYSLADAESLPDFDDMVVDSDERPPPVFSQTEQYGPPELGTIDDDLYVPHNPTIDISSPGQHDDSELTSSVPGNSITNLLACNNFLDSSVTCPEEGAIHIDSPQLTITSDLTLVASESLQGQSNSTANHTLDAYESPRRQPNSWHTSGASESPERISKSATPDCPGFNLILDVGPELPLVFKDTPFDSFTGLRCSRVSLPVHGCYTHDDIQSIIANSPEGGGIDTAKVSLDVEIMDQHKAQWNALHQELFRNQLCLVIFLPETSDALIIFSSQSKAFGKAIGANTRRLGWGNTIIVCCVKALCHPVPFEKQICSSL